MADLRFGEGKSEATLQDTTIIPCRQTTGDDEYTTPKAIAEAMPSNVNGYDRYTTASMPDVTFDDTTRTVSVSVKTGSSDFYFWVNNEKITKTTTQTVVLPDVTGAYYVYFDNSGVIQYILQSSVTSVAFYSYAITTFVYWNASNGTYLMNGDELHGKDMAGVTHESLHMTTGARYSMGLAIEGLADASPTYTQSAFGIIYDEDIPHVLTANNTGHKMLYRFGTDGAWRTTSADLAVGHTEGGSYYTWNEWTGTTWQWTEGASSTDYWITFFLATPNGVIKTAGQNAYSSRSAAREAIETEVNNINTNGLPNPEMVWLGAVIVRRDGDLEEMSDGSVFYDLKGVRGSGSASSGAVYAEDVPTDVTNFDNNLSSTDDTVQKALETLDDMSAGGSSIVTIDILSDEGAMVTGELITYTVERAFEIDKVYSSISLIPTGSNATTDVRRNGNVSTDSIFTSDTPLTHATTDTLTNGRSSKSSDAIDNGTCAVGDVLTFTNLQVGSTIAGADQQIKMNITYA